MPGAIICAKCKGHRVDVNEWVDENTALVRCYECGNTAPLAGFTIGRFYTLPTEVVNYVMQEAMADRAEYGGPADHGNRPTQTEVRQAIGSLLDEAIKSEKDPQGRSELEKVREQLRASGRL